MSWGRGPKKAKKSCTTTFTSLPPCPCHERLVALVAVLYQSMTTSMQSAGTPFFQTRCQGHPQAGRGTDVRVQGYFHVQHKTSRRTAIFTDAMGHRRLYRKMSRKDGNHGGPVRDSCFGIHQVSSSRTTID